MDNTTNPNPVPNASAQATQSVAQTSQSVVQPVQTPPDAVSGGNPEAAPISVAPMEVAAMPSETEPVLHPEVQEAGVEVVTEPQPVITPEQKAIGMQLAKESVPVDGAPAALSHLPLTATRALLIKKKKTPVTESIRWLAELVIEQLKRAHQQLSN